MDLSNENVIHIKKVDCEYLQFRKLLEYDNLIKHAYAIGLDKNYRTARVGNAEIKAEEYELAVKSYKDICKELNINYNDIVKTNQLHTDNVKIIEEKILKDRPDFAIYKETDGLITNKQDLVLSTTNADCILLIFFDPVKKVIANTHSGWRGTLQRISVKTVEKMEAEYGCNPSDIICCMCPSIRKCHFEVDEDVYKMFYNEFNDLNEIDEIIEPKGEKWHIDTILINKIILKQIGLLEENIVDSGICSVCNKDLIHSFRAEGEGYGLNTAIISLN
ncbi:MAG: peptidoglycan editing factor PgeF [Clostridia bacterium]|nr:peptidoglycan editing factor PgeF [Clostridia bacterium]